MVDILNTPVQTGDNFSTKHEGTATTVATDYKFPSVQDSIIVNNYGIDYITATVNGKSERIRPGGGYYRFSEDSDTVTLKAAPSSSSKFMIEGRSLSSGAGSGVDMQARSQIQELLNDKVISFPNLSALQAAYPNGISRPVWIENEKTWYTWVGDTYISELCPTANSKSTTANWKGTAMLLKQNIKLIEVGSVGTPDQWQLWDVVAGKLSSMLSSGTFTDIIDSVGVYNKSLVPSPVSLLAGKTYILLVKYNPISSYYTTGEANGVNDDFVDVTIETYNRTTTPVKDLVLTTDTTNNFVYKHYVKYEKL